MNNSTNALVSLTATHDKERTGKENNENNKHGAITKAQEILEYSAGVSLVFMKCTWVQGKVFPLLVPSLLPIPRVLSKISSLSLFIFSPDLGVLYFSCIPYMPTATLEMWQNF